MPKRLKVELLPNWTQQPNPRGPASFYRTDSPNPGALQFSIKAEYKSGKIPDPSPQELIDLAKGHGERHHAGIIIDSSSGSCRFGKFGTVVFRSANFARIQFWYLSNGKDFVFATHVCTKEPQVAECTEAQSIVDLVTLAAEAGPAEPAAVPDPAT